VNVKARKNTTLYALDIARGFSLVALIMASNFP